MKKQNTIADRIPYIITVEEYLAEQRHSFFSNVLLTLLEAGGHYPLQYKRTFIKGKTQDVSDMIDNLDRLFSILSKGINKNFTDNCKESVLGGSGSGRSLYFVKPNTVNNAAKEVMTYGR